MAKKRVVVVDDTMSIGRFLQIALKTLDPNLAVAVVPSAEEAVLEVGSTKVDLLITDINLPGISGLDLARKIRVRFPETEIILITGMSDYPLDQKASELGAAAYFQKPLDTALFLEAASRCLGIEPKTQPISASAKPVPAAPEVDLPDRLARLRQAVDASSVLLLNDRGRIAAQAGNLPSAAFEQDWTLTLMSAMSACNKVAPFLGGDIFGDCLVFSGKDMTLVLSSVGAFGLVFIFKPEKFNKQISAIYEQILAVQKELLDVLTDMGASILVKEKPVTGGLHPPATTAPAEAVEAAPVEETVEDSAAAAHLAALLQSSETLSQTDADAFWESAVGESAPKVNPDVIDFDQARRLGLAPEET